MNYVANLTIIISGCDDVLRGIVPVMHAIILQLLKKSVACIQFTVPIMHAIILQSLGKHVKHVHNYAG